MCVQLYRVSGGAGQYLLNKSQLPCGSLLILFSFQQERDFFFFLTRLKMLAVP